MSEDCGVGWLLLNYIDAAQKDNENLWCINEQFRVKYKSHKVLQQKSRFSGEADSELDCQNGTCSEMFKCPAKVGLLY